MTLTRLEQLVLYWSASFGPDHISLGYFTHHLDAGPPADQEIRKECYLADVPVPSKEEFLDVLQSLIERGYACAVVGDTDWGDYEELQDVRKLPDGVDPWDVSLERTDEGQSELPESFHDEMRGNTANMAQFTRKFVVETCEGLPFPAVIPAYILTDEKILKSLEVLSDNETGLRLDYEFGWDPWIRVTIDQSISEHPPMDSLGTVVSARTMKVGSISVSLREEKDVHVAQIVAEWLNRPVAWRVWFRIGDSFDPDYNPTPKPISIDPATRRQALRIVRSCLSTPSTSRGSKK